MADGPVRDEETVVANTGDGTGGTDGEGEDVVDALGDVAADMNAPQINAVESPGLERQNTEVASGTAIGSDTKMGLIPNNGSSAAADGLLNQKMESSEVEDEPSAEEKEDFQNEARENLEHRLGDASPEDKAKAVALQDAILKGDADALAKAVAGMTPEQLRNFSKEIQGNLDDMQAGVTVKPTGDGKSLFVHEKGSSTGMIISNDGTSRAVSVRTSDDGKTHIDNTSTPTDDVHAVAGSISNAATINSRPPLASIGGDSGTGISQGGSPANGSTFDLKNPATQPQVILPDNEPIIQFPRRAK